MSVQVSISAKVPEELRRQVDRLAAATHRNRSWVVAAALRAYLARELEFVEAVEAGIQQREAGEVIPHTDVVAYVRDRRATETE
ncbi:MAG TPA: ribbon-helix-helix protein, CopG family [Chloroflexia bacterium]